MAINIPVYIVRYGVRYQCRAQNADTQDLWNSEIVTELLYLVAWVT